MRSMCRTLVFVLCLSYVYSQKFEAESPFLNIRWLDMNLAKWKPDMLDQLEKTLDSEMKYIDERKGVECRSIDFVEEEGYPKNDGRFLDTSIRGFCHDETGKVHNIPKEIITVAIERRIDEVAAVTGSRVYSVGNIQMYKRGQNLLNLIIIPVSVGFVLILFIFTFVIRRIRYAQKRRHIVSELEKQKKIKAEKAGSVPNPDPLANENQRLLQLDPNVVGNASNTLGSPKEFTNDSHPSPTRTNPSREYQNTGSATAAPRDTRTTLNSRSQPSYENEPRFPYDPKHPDMIPMQEQQPRVVVRTIRDDGSNPSNYYSQQYPDPSTRFVPIPVQVERTGPEQRFVPPPYHSDPYYRHNNV